MVSFESKLVCVRTLTVRAVRVPGNVRLMSEEPEKTVEDLEQRSEELEEEIEETRDDWERKQQDSSVPGAKDSDAE